MSEGNEVQSIPEGSRCYGEINEDRGVGGVGGRGGTITVLPTLGPRGLMTREDRHPVTDGLRYWGQAGLSIRDQISNRLRHRVLP